MNKPGLSSRPVKFQERPFFIKILVLFFVLLSLVNFLRGGIAIHQWYFYQQYAAAPLPLYLVLSGFTWGISLLLTGILLWLRLMIAVYFAGGVSILLVIVFWLERAFLQVDPSRWHNLVFIILIQSLLLIFVFASLWYVYPRKESVTKQDE